MANATFIDVDWLNKIYRDANIFFKKEAQVCENFPSNILYRSPMDYTYLIALFPGLALKPNLEIQVYYFMSEAPPFFLGDIWAMPRGTLSSKRPPTVRGFAIEQPIEAISITHALKELNLPSSYMSSSLMMRAIDHLRRRSIHSDWMEINVIDIDKMKSEGELRFADPTLLDLLDNSNWLEEKPIDWRPRIIKDEQTTKVLFYSYNSSYPASIIQYTDTYVDNIPVFTTERRTLVSDQTGIQF